MELASMPLEALASRTTAACVVTVSVAWGAERSGASAGRGRGGLHWAVTQGKGLGMPATERRVLSLDGRGTER